MQYLTRFTQIAAFCAAVFTLYSGNLFSRDTEDSGRLESYEEELEERDWDALRSYLRSRRDEEKDQSKSALLLSGNARVDWRNKQETIELDGDRVSLYGGDATDFKGIRRGRNRFDVEVNLRLDYDLDRSWMVIHWQYDNKAGIDDETNCFDKNSKGVDTCYCREMFGSGNCGSLCLKKAYFGYNLYKCGDTEFDIEIGRRYLYDVFDSKVQFLSRFDGILLSYGGIVKEVVDYYIHVGGFVVDYRANHFAWITEVGALNIYGSNFDFKYSIIDWRKNGHNRCSDRVKGCKQDLVCCPERKDDCCDDGFRCGDRNPPGTKFVISQWTAAYGLKKDCWLMKDTWYGRDAILFGAFLINHENPHPTCTPPNQNKAWYVGLRFGEVRKEGDWAFQVMYQWVQAFAMPNLDMSGIGNGNTLDNLTFTDLTGNTNFKGWRFDGMYAFTDEIVINARCQWSTELAKKLYCKESHYFREIKVEMVYTF